MTSEGQHAGQQPGATSGSGAGQFGADGFPPDAFPPDSDGHPTADRAPSYPHAQESFPSAYAPPPHATPNGGSPFVVPAVPPAGQAASGSAAPGSPGAQQPGSPSPAFPPPSSQSPGFPPTGSQPPGFPPPSSQSPGFPPTGSQPPGFPPPSSQSPGFPPADSPPGFPPAGSQPPGSPSAGPQSRRQAAGPQAAGDDSGTAAPGPAFGPGAAKFSSSGTARVPEPGALPQRPSAVSPGHADSFATPESLESVWAPRQSAQPAAEDNPFTRPAEPHPYRGGAGVGELPQRSPGIAGGPLDGPVGEFNGFAPARQPAESAPGAGPDMPRRAGSPFDRQDPAPADRPPFAAPADQPPFGTAERSSFAPAPREPFGGAPAGEPFGSARTDDDGQAGDRPPGVSAFGDQRVRVPGATLTGLPDAPPAGPDGAGVPAARGSSESGGFPIRGSGESGGFPIRGGSGNGSFPIRGAGARGGDGLTRGDAESSAFPARSDAGSGLPTRGGFPTGAEPSRGDVDSDGFPARPDSDSNPFRDGTFRREDADGGFAAPATPDSRGFPMRGAADGESGPGRPVSGHPDGVPAPRGYGDRPDDGGEPSPFGRPEPSDGPGDHGYVQRIPGASFATAGPPEGGSAGYPQRVPGSSFGAAGSPAVAESRGAAAVPQPRDPSERPDSGESSAAERPGPAKGTARPVSASASVPVASRVTPPVDAEEVPPPAVVSPPSRVYGRPAPADEPASPSPYQDEEQPGSGAFGAAPASGARGQAPDSPYGRPADGTYGKPPQSDGTYGRPPEAPFGTRPSSGASPFADGGDDRADPFAQPEHGGAHAGGFGTVPSSGAPEAAPTSGPFGAAPTSGGAQPPGRPSGRATASARVSPPPAGQPFAPASPAAGPIPDARNAAQFSEFTTDIAGRGRSDQPGPVPGNPAARTMPPDQYSENTTDVSGRGQGSEQQPYVPAAALPSMHAAPPLENGFPPAQASDSTQPFGERPRMGGVFPGPASRATVTPPGPEQTAAWPGRPEPDADQSRFDSFKQDAPEIVPTEVAKPETPHVRMLPVILGVILGAALIVGLTLGVTWLIARGSHDGGSTFSVSAGDCVKRNGEAAVTANCSDPGSFEVTAIVDTKEQCPDPNQPYVVNPTDNGRTQVLCLKPRS